jgi:hypothetical protein
VSARDVVLARGCAAQLATALACRDHAAWNQVVADLPPLAEAVQDAALTFAMAACWSLSVQMCRPATLHDAARCWAEHADIIAWELSVRYGLASPHLPAAVAWLGSVLADPDHARQPHTDPVLCLFLAAMATEEMFAPFPEQLPRFLLHLEAARG